MYLAAGSFMFHVPNRYRHQCYLLNINIYFFLYTLVLQRCSRPAMKQCCVKIERETIQLHEVRRENMMLINSLNIFFPFTAKATYAAIAKTYAYLTPDLWKETVFTKSPYQEFTDYLAKNHRPVASQRQEVKQY